LMVEEGGALGGQMFRVRCFCLATQIFFLCKHGRQQDPKSEFLPKKGSENSDLFPTQMFFFSAYRQCLRVRGWSIDPHMISRGQVANCRAGAKEFFVWFLPRESIYNLQPKTRSTKVRTITTSPWRKAENKSNRMGWAPSEYWVLQDYLCK
jgi:hypothetical protein